MQEWRATLQFQNWDTSSVPQVQLDNWVRQDGVEWLVDTMDVDGLVREIFAEGGASPHLELGCSQLHSFGFVPEVHRSMYS